MSKGSPEVAIMPPGCSWEFHSGVVGLSLSLRVYDGGMAAGHASDLPDSEVVALADYMIALWTRFRAGRRLQDQDGGLMVPDQNTKSHQWWSFFIGN
jgi:hypothetical protein